MCILNTTGIFNFTEDSIICNSCLEVVPDNTEAINEHIKQCEPSEQELSTQENFSQRYLEFYLERHKIEQSVGTILEEIKSKTQ